MSAVGVVVILLLVAAGVIFLVSRQRGETRRELADAQAEARRLVERLGGQVLNLQGSDVASKQALADAAERYTAASSQLEGARTPAQCRLVVQTALEGLYYVRAARTAMGMDPGPELPTLAGQAGAGAVTEDREVDVDGRRLTASPRPSERASHYYPGGRIAGRPVPAGWYSEPWWRSALVGGAWGLGSFLLFDALFSGMDGMSDATAWDQGYDGGGFDGGGFDGGGFDGGGFDGGGFDGGGFDGGGFGDY